MNSSTEIYKGEYQKIDINSDLININSDPKIINKFDAWICHPSPKFIIKNDLLDYAKNLKIIATPSTGVNHISLLISLLMVAL